MGCRWSSRTLRRMNLPGGESRSGLCKGKPPLFNPTIPFSTKPQLRLRSTVCVCVCVCCTSLRLSGRSCWGRGGGVNALQEGSGLRGESVRESLPSVISVPSESAVSVIFTDCARPPASSTSCKMTAKITCCRPT